jgi:DNA adenine methylase
MASSLYTLVPFPWYGSKAMSLPYILAVLPETEIYCEPFGGAAVVLLNKKPSKLEIFNDICSDIVCFFRVLRERPNQLIWRLWFTPYSRKTFLEALSKLERREFADDIDHAWAFYVVTSQSFRARIGKTWRIRLHHFRWHGLTVETHSRLDTLIVVSQRLRDVLIENQDAFQLIPRVDSPDTVFYVDPPWAPDALSSSPGHYSGFTALDHDRLADLLHSLKGKVVYSGRRSPTTDKLYADWVRVDLPPRKKFLSSLSHQRGVHTESIWLNYEPSPDAVRLLEGMGAQIILPAIRS